MDISIQLSVTMTCFSNFFTVFSLVTVKLSYCKSYCSIFSSNSDFFSGLFPKSLLPISNKYDGADLKTKMDTKSALQKEYVDRKSFDVEEIGNKLFGKSPEKKSEFDEKMEQYDLQYDNFTVTNENTVKKLEKQVMVTDSGIEISIPMETYNKLANFEVQTDVTGKSTIIIRNIDNLVLK